MTTRQQRSSEVAKALQAKMAELGLSTRELAQIMGLSVPQLSLVVKGRTSMTALTALRLEAALGEPARHWMDLQRDEMLGGLASEHEDELNRITERAEELLWGHDAGDGVHDGDGGHPLPDPP